MSATNFAKIRKLVIEISCLKKWLHTHRRYRVGCTIIGRSTLFTWSLCSNSGALQAWARVAKPPICSLIPTIKHTGQEWGGDLRILIVFAVIISKQCLQTALALALLGLRPWTPLRHVHFSDRLGYSSQTKIPGAAIALFPFLTPQCLRTSWSQCDAFGVLNSCPSHQILVTPLSDNLWQS